MNYCTNAYFPVICICWLDPFKKMFAEDREYDKNYYFDPNRYSFYRVYCGNFSAGFKHKQYHRKRFNSDVPRISSDRISVEVICVDQKEE